jgi:hypothetical protein
VTQIGSHVVYFAVSFTLKWLCAHDGKDNRITKKEGYGVYHEGHNQGNGHTRSATQKIAA